MKKSKYLFTSVLPLVLLSSTAFFSNAHAGIESAHLYQRGDSDCRDDQAKMEADWRPNYPRLKLGGDGTHQIEAFGHLMDLSGDASFSGLPQPHSARIIKRNNGNANWNNKCGAVGSVVVEVKLPKVSGLNHAILHIGNEQIPIAVYPNQFELVRWDKSKNKSEATSSGSNSSTTSNSNFNSAPGITVGGSTGCPSGSNSSGCTSGNTVTYIVRDTTTRSGSGSGTITKRTLTRCGYEYGLKSDRASDTLLRIELPEIRTSLLNNCGNFGIFANYLYRSELGASSSLNYNTEINSTVTATNGLPISHVMQPDQDGSGIRYGDFQFFINKSFLESFVGVKRFEIDILPSYNDFTLSLELISKPEFGPKNVSAPLFPQNIGSANSVGRLQSNLTFKVTPYYTASVSQAYNWKIVSNQVTSVATCFTETSGRINSSVGANLIEIPLTIKENETCYDKQFSFEVYTNTNPVLGANTLFDKTVNFTLPPLTRVMIPQNNAPKVTAPVGIRVGN